MSYERVRYRFGEVIIAACNQAFASIESLRRWGGRTAVETISTEQLRQALSETNPEIVLIDVRGHEEQLVSRISGAISWQDYEANSRAHAGKTVVPYCTVGGRSYWYATRLANAGIPCKNYRASILGWCRAGLPLESPQGEPTNRVHPYWRVFDVSRNCVSQTKPDS